MNFDKVRSKIKASFHFFSFQICYRSCYIIRGIVPKDIHFDVYWESKLDIKINMSDNGSENGDKEEGPVLGVRFMKKLAVIELLGLRRWKK
jgi:hypothetical protein